MRYCLDSMVFVWAIKKIANEGQEYRLEQATQFMELMRKGRHQLIIPTIVLAESLIGSPEENHNEIIAEAYRRAQVVDFDTRAAMQYGTMLRMESFQEAKRIAIEAGVSRQKMKLDHTIVACAIANNADGIFSDDPGITKFANGLIKVHPLSSVPIQTKLELENG